MRYNDWPPTHNVPAPYVDPRLIRELQEIGGRIDVDMPVIILTWGQDITNAANKAWHPGRGPCLKFFHHNHTKNVLGVPDMQPDLTTDPMKPTFAFKGWKKFYEENAVIPVEEAAIIQKCELVTEVGINRWFLQYAQPIDPKEWEAEKLKTPDGMWYTPAGLPAGGILLDKDGKSAIDWLGPLPAGSITYLPLAHIASHEGTCQCEWKGEGVHIGACCCEQAKLGEGCYGQYREFARKDVEWVRRRWANMERARSNIYGFRDKVPEHLVSWATESDRKEALKEEWERYEQLRDDLIQEMMPHSTRLTGPGHAVDSIKYHDLGSPTLTAGDNQSERRFGKNQGSLSIPPISKTKKSDAIFTM